MSAMLPPGLEQVLNNNPTFLAAYQQDPSRFLTIFHQQQSTNFTAQGITAQTPAPIPLTLAALPSNDYPLLLTSPNNTITVPKSSVAPPIPPTPLSPPPTPTFSLEGDREEKGVRFTIEEDERICRCWLRVTEDPVVGTQQKLDAFWKRITDLFNSGVAGPKARTSKAVSNRWHKITRSVNAFGGCYRRAEDLLPSGEDNVWVMKQAHTFYKDKERVSFGFLHCWQILKACPKFMSSGSKAGDAFIAGDLGERPEGVKSAKKRKREGNGDGGVLDDEAKKLLEKGLDLKAKEEARLARASKIAEVKDLIFLYGKDDPLVVKLLSQLRETLAADLE